MTTIVQIATSVDWLYLLDSTGTVWEKPLPAAELGSEWKALPPLPRGFQGVSLLVTADGAVYVATKGGRLFKYLAERWEDETPPFTEPLQ
jgi:hypothetical protein